MTPERLKQLIDAYGADPRRWPEDERPMRAIPETSRGEAASLDAMLDTWSVPPLKLDPLRIVARASAKAPTVAQLRIAWPNFAGLAAAAIVGFVVGWSGIDDAMTRLSGGDPGDVLSSILVEDELTW